jgi:hypothetical protein
MTPARAIAWGVGPLTVLVGCSSVLGLDPPTLDPCIALGCLDGSTGPDSSAADAAPDGPTETDAVVKDVGVDATDAGPETGVRCGGGAYPTTYCAGTTPTCCQTTTDAGVTTYGCVASETACTGYAIDCATYDDCAGNDICCHFSTHMVCDSVASCMNANVVCTTAMSDSCPSGWTCNVYFANAGVESPYMGCSQ